MQSRNSPPLWYPKVRYRIHNSSPLVPILRQMHSVHNFQTYFPKIHSNVILPSTPRPGFFPSGFLTKIMYAFLISSMPATCTVHESLAAFPFLSSWYEMLLHVAGSSGPELSDSVVGSFRNL